MKQFDFIVIGSGISGLNFALNASKKGKVLVVTKKKIIESSTNYAQGGIAAVLDRLDNFDKHIEDTLKAGAYHNNKAAVKYMVEHGPEEIVQLAGLGVPFEEEKGKFKLTKEGGHSKRRIAFVGDRTGHSIEKALIKAVRSNKNIEIWEDTFAIDLLVKNNVCYGVQILRDDKVENIFASAVILATGGLGRVFKYTTNPRISTGDGLAMAIRAGAKVKDLEFIQFHPTALNLPRKKRFLLSEALRGEGAKLVNYAGKRFTDELLPRDKVAMAIYQELKKGPVYLDFTHKEAKYIKTRFKHIYEELKKRGVDLTKDKIPVAPAAHYACGGVEVDLSGKTSIKNLFAFGEVACTGVHGANRLASNSLLEAVVFSARIVKEISKSKNRKLPSFKLVSAKENKKIDQKYVKSKLQKIMWENVGILREQNNLESALNKLNRLNKKFTLNKIDQNSLEIRNLLSVSIVIVQAAIKRKKSLGCHSVT